jgi:hypothetical protein
VSFWVPGFFGSLAAAPLVPGLTWANIYYHTDVKAGGDVAFARQVNRGNITVNFNGNLRADINADADLYLAVPSYTFAQPLLGGQATILALIPYGRARASVDATLTGNLGLGGPGFTISGGRTDQVDGFGDLGAQFNVRWNHGVHNYMTYVATNVTTGRYDLARLVNLGIGHNGNSSVEVVFSRLTKFVGPMGADGPPPYAETPEEAEHRIALDACGRDAIVVGCGTIPVEADVHALRPGRHVRGGETRGRSQHDGPQPPQPRQLSLHHADRRSA